MKNLCCANHVGEWRFFWIEIDDTPIRQFQRSDSAHPDVKWNRSHVRDVENRFRVVTDEVSNVALSVLAPDWDCAHPIRRELWRVFLIKRFSFDSVRKSRQHDWPVSEIGKEPRRNRAIVLDQ